MSSRFSFEILNDVVTFFVISIILSIMYDVLPIGKPNIVTPSVFSLFSVNSSRQFLRFIWCWVGRYGKTDVLLVFVRMELFCYLV